MQRGGAVVSTFNLTLNVSPYTFDSLAREEENRGLTEYIDRIGKTNVD